MTKRKEFRAYKSDWSDAERILSELFIPGFTKDFMCKDQSVHMRPFAAAMGAMNIFYRILSTEFIDHVAKETGANRFKVYAAMRSALKLKFPIQVYDGNPFIYKGEIQQEDKQLP